VLGVHDVDVGALASGDGAYKDDRMLLNYPEHVSYAKVFTFGLLC
jgi:hypothetical protein